MAGADVTRPRRTPPRATRSGDSLDARWHEFPPGRRPVPGPPALARVRLERPLAFLSLRATGADPALDRLVEVAVLRAEPGPTCAQFHSLVRPEPVTERVATCAYALSGPVARTVPLLAEVADKILAILDSADLAAFDLRRTLPLLNAELAWAGLDLPLAGRALIDLGDLAREQGQTDLDAAVGHYLGLAPLTLHGSGFAARLAADILDAQLAHDPSLPGDPRRLHDELGRRGVVPALLPWNRPLELLGWGRFAGQPLGRVARVSPAYLLWMLGQEITGPERGSIALALARVGVSVGPPGRPNRR
ncbi:MAG: hypothetical protein U0835_08545 [Isosphaeraceae bacterium]